MIKSFVNMSYGCLYASDLQKSFKWYNQAFGFMILSINSDFAQLEIAPGRVMFLERDEQYRSRKMTFRTSNIKALRRQLALAGVEMENDDEHFLRIKDPEGNTIEVMTQGFEIEHMRPSMPDHFVRELVRCRLETKNEMHLLTRKIMDDSEFVSISKELLSLCQQLGLGVEDNAIIVSHYSKQVDAVYVGIPITESPAAKLPDEIQYIQIPRQDYSVFPIDYLMIDNLRDHHIPNRAKFMPLSFTRPESFYTLEYYKDDAIHLYMPYEWDIGWQEHDAKQIVNKGGDLLE